MSAFQYLQQRYAKDMNDRTVQSIRTSYDQLSDEYARQLFNELRNKPLDRQLLDRFVEETAGRGKVYDMGCGPGQVACYLRNCGADVFGLDLSPRMVEQAQQLNPDIRFEEGNMMALGLEDGSLAGIAAFYAIVNIPEESLPQIFREIERVLQPGGLLLLAFHTGEEIIQVRELWGRPISLDFFFFNLSAVRQHIQAAGLTIEQIIERGPYAPEVEHQSHRAYVFARKQHFGAEVSFAKGPSR